jgi:retron-type reverse transcriptase
VVPLYKKGEHYDIKNYRPVSILSAFSKILEKFMYNRLMPFLIQNNIITEAQNGFRKSKSTVTASQSFIESIQEALDSGLHVTGLFFDLSKAYDVIDHDILLDKLDSYGIRGVSNIWFRSVRRNKKH